MFVSMSVGTWEVGWGGGMAYKQGWYNWNAHFCFTYKVEGYPNRTLLGVVFYS